MFLNSQHEDQTTSKNYNTPQTCSIDSKLGRLAAYILKSMYHKFDII